MIYVRMYHTDEGYIVAMCDEALLGRKFNEGKLELDLDKYGSFYKGDLMSEEDARAEVSKRKFYTANIVGSLTAMLTFKPQYQACLQAHKIGL